MVDEEKKSEKHGPEAHELKEVLSVVSAEVPSMIKSILSSVFSEEAGKNMGKAAAAYYKELKNGGLPEQVAVKMTEDYMKTFTSIGDMLKGVGKHGVGDEMGKDIEKKIRLKVQEKMHDEEEDEDEEEEE
jgi:hypothetical protein